MFFFLTILSNIFQILPRFFSLRIGRSIGLMMYYFYPKRKDIAIKNIEIAFPSKTLTLKHAILKSCYKHYGMVLVDFLRLPKIKKKKDKKIVNIPIESINLLKKYNGGIILSAHIGNWEYIGPSLGINNIKCAGVAQVQHNSKSNKFFNTLRSSKNVKIIPINAGSKIMINYIKQGYFLGLISDQNAGKKGSEAIFFNKTISTPKGAAAFHLKTHSPILLGFCILHKDLNYELSFQKLNLKGLPKNSDEAIIEINQRFTSLLENMVCKYPEQYFWFHKKWNHDNYKKINNN